MRTFFTDSRRASGARHVVRRGTAMGPHAYGLRPTRTPPHLTGSRPRTTKRTPRFSLGTSSPPSRQPFAGASGRHSRPVKPQLQHGPGEHSVFLPQHRRCHRGLTVLAVYLKRSAIGSVALSAWPRSGPNAVHAMQGDERPRRPSNALSCGPIVCRQSGGQGAAGSNPVIPTGTRRRPEAVSEKSGAASRPVPASSPGTPAHVQALPAPRHRGLIFVIRARRC